ncbi:nucleotide exchange factor GrpE [Sphingomonas bacterium]|uniref:nucleotide exchange factor GrpE n=1 Tax=Sphingomonas bacterium TaxID=1895847 RepID=UPI001576F7A8|nr:nucleotide exchange factor GrpE [Sphingomonas bacterium]
MTDETTTEAPAPADDLRAETAAAAPELAEHDRTAELEAQLAEARQQALYARAEAENVRRRAEKEAADTRAYAVTSFARDVLGVADNLGRGLAAMPADAHDDPRFKGLLTGLAATGRELDKVLERHGITKIAALGEMLDPNRHQAMLELPSDEPPGTVVQEMQAGYLIKDRLLRPALVGVAKAAE